MVGELVRSGMLALTIVTLLDGCERVPRAREREARAAAAKAKERARAPNVQAHVPEPLPEEPRVELLRVANSGLPCKVDDVFASKCRRCHTVPARHGAPFVFLTWEDTRQSREGQPVAAMIGRAVRSHFMPYRIEANPPVQPLTEEERTTILDWVDAGGPREDCPPRQPNSRAVPAKPKASSQRIDAAPAPSTRPAR